MPDYVSCWHVDDFNRLIHAKARSRRHTFLSPFHAILLSALTFFLSFSSFLFALPAFHIPVFVRDLYNTANEDHVLIRAVVGSYVVTRPSEKAALNCIFDLHADQRGNLGIRTVSIDCVYRSCAISGLVDIRITRT